MIFVVAANLVRVIYGALLWYLLTNDIVAVKACTESQSQMKAHCVGV